MAKIIGTPVGTTMPRADWNQTDPTKADYIKNKPDIIGTNDALQTAYSYILQGRNLLRETNQGAKRWGYRHNGSEYTIVPSTEDDGKGVQLTVTKVGSFSFLQYDIHELLHQLEPNARYILGFDYKVTSGTLINAVIQNIDASGQLTDVQRPSLVGDAVWRRCEVALTTNELESIANQVLYIYLYTFVGELSIRNLKFEKGCRATEWCPAPEDVIGDFPELTEATAKTFNVVEQYVVDHPKSKRITIADYTTEVETPTLYHNTDIDGNPFNCKLVAIQIIFPEQKPTFAMRVSMTDQFWKQPAFAFTIPNPFAVVNAMFTTNGDYVDMLSSATLAEGAYCSSIPAYLIQTQGDTKELTHVTIHTAVSGETYPVGTKIKIWGLKS